MKIVIFILLLFCFQNMYCQELFVVTDPASNVPANSLGINVMQLLFKEQIKTGYNYHLMPE